MRAAYHHNRGREEGAEGRLNEGVSNSRSWLEVCQITFPRWLVVQRTYLCDDSHKRITARTARMGSGRTQSNFHCLPGFESSVIGDVIR